MGRTNPTYRDRLQKLETDWGAYRRALRLQDQEAFDILIEAARNYADASGNLNPADIEVTVFLSIALAQQRELIELRQRVTALEEEVGDAVAAE